IAIDSKIADWTKLRAQLEDLLEKPKEQKPPPQQNQQNQKKDQSKKDSDKNQQQQNQQNQNQPQQNQPDQQQKDQSRDDRSQQNKSDANQSQPGQRDKPKDESAFGNMQNHQKPPPSPQDMQKVGGAPEKREGDKMPVDPSLAVPLQKLDRLRNQDSPAELFQLMDSDKKPVQQKPKKDW
ncbi:MAG TPA: hypothetical protein VG710_01090, partial [Opitutus sp.]|nr:hypothetical protein [Opitutus sp.]